MECPAFSEIWLNLKPSLSQPPMHTMKCLAGYFTEVTEAVVSRDMQLRQVSQSTVVIHNPNNSNIY